MIFNLPVGFTTDNLFPSDICLFLCHSILDGAPPRKFDFNFFDGILYFPDVNCTIRKILVSSSVNLVAKIANLQLFNGNDVFTCYINIIIPLYSLSKKSFLCTTYAYVSAQLGYPFTNKFISKLNVPVQNRIFPLVYLQWGVILTMDNLTENNWVGKLC